MMMEPKKNRIQRIFTQAFPAPPRWTDWFFDEVYSDDEAMLLTKDGMAYILSNAVKSTTLTARVWHGSEDVTAQISDTRFCWRRVSADATADALWNAAHAGMKSIQLTVLDVQYSATYQCELSDA